MKAGWELFRLGDLTDLITKGTTPTSVGFDFTINGVNFIKVESLTENGCFIDAKLASISEKCHQALARSQIKEGDILFSIAGALGRTAIVPASILPANTNQALSIIRLKKSENILPKFIFTALGTGFLLEQIDKFKGGVAQQNLSLAQVRDFQIPIPPVVEQQRIVTILDQAFEGIAKARTKAEQNLQNARALFESHLQSVFTQRGDGWVQKKLGEIAELFDSLHKTPSYQNVGYPMVRVTDIKPGILNLSNTRKVDKNTFVEFSKKHTPVPGDIVFSRVGSYGVSALVNTNEAFCLGQNTVFIVPKINSYLLYYFLNSSNAKDQIDGFVDGTTQPTISLKNIREIIVSIPHQNQQQDIVDNFDALSKETQRLEALYQRKIALLDELKKSLLQQAFAGEL